MYALLLWPLALLELGPRIAAHTLTTAYHAITAEERSK